ncbi:unnamed protein product [Lathyrus sativus]|nr:unnamed protein product [Lathyrus sativus]
MKHNNIVKKFISKFLILVTILLVSTKWTIAEEVDDQREFDYTKEDEHEFDYTKGSKKSPPYWGELKKEWAACKNGKMQSPIDMTNDNLKIVPNLGRIEKNYKPKNAILKNRGHDIQVKWLGDAGSIKINGTKFFLHQAHWHSPSEHTIDGSRYEVELHMVHESPIVNGKSETAVLGVLYKFGPSDPILTKLSKHIKAMVNNISETNIGDINPSEFVCEGDEYYQYVGSLTVPPCTEGVIWTINKKVGTVSEDQVSLLRKAVQDHATKNARPLQPRNGRDILYYDPKEK